MQQAFTDAGLESDRAEITMVPQNTVPVDVETGRKVLRLMDVLDNDEDVQQVHANFDLPDELLAEMEG